MNMLKNFKLKKFQWYQFFLKIYLFCFFVVVHGACQDITIYVHGTTTSLGLRLISKFYPEVSFGAPGLHHVLEMNGDALMLQDVKLLEQKDPNRFCMQYFYTFGWSGKLLKKAREKAGCDLYHEICGLLKKYKKKYGVYPKIRLLTFSHGGNVALEMIKHLPFFVDQVIELELVLVAIPVQKTTEKYIENKHIKCSYVISSSRDLLQVVDCYRHDDGFHIPNRFFNTTILNCKQIEVAINNRGLGHMDLMRSFMVHLPDALNYADLTNLSDCSKKNDQYCARILYSTQDPKFRFYNVLNLSKVVRGVRKP